MQNIVDILAAVLGVYFIVAMLSLWRYLLFKKGSWKKSLLHVLASVVLLCGLIGFYLWQGNLAAANTPEPGTFTAEMKQLLDTTAPEDASFNEMSQIIVLSNYPIEEADKVYLDKIKAYYVYYHMSGEANQKSEEELAQEFDASRERVDFAQQQREEMEQQRAQTAQP